MGTSCEFGAYAAVAIANAETKSAVDFSLFFPFIKLMRFAKPADVA